MGYYIDLSRISLDAFKNKLALADLLPSQKILKEQIDERFYAISDQQIENLDQLQQALSTKSKVEHFAKTTGLPADYLTVLRREINSYHPQPRKIKDFSCLSAETKERLEKKGIRTTVELYDRIATKSDRNALMNELKISEEESLLLAKLTDVSRLRYVNQDFATLLVNSDYDTVEKIKQADHQSLYENLTKINGEKRYFKGRINLSDMKFLIKDAATLSLDIMY